MQEVDDLDRFVAEIPSDRPVLIAGPTASGKSALALRIAQAAGGVVVNADASQVYDCWRIITARPTRAEERTARHLLYGHIAYDASYSAGHWLRDVAKVLDGPRPIIVGGTGLYFTALTEGLADIPAIGTDIRGQADALSLDDLVAGLDAVTAGRIDLSNRARVQRAWEVLNQTGKGLAHWQDTTASPLLPVGKTVPIVIDAPKDVLTPRIKARFERMIAEGGLDEARAMQDRYDPNLPSCKAIGVPQMMALATGMVNHQSAVEAAVIATRQYAKRQRTWFRSKMQAWQRLDVSKLLAT